MHFSSQFIRALVLSILSLAMSAAFAQTPVGTWKTIDDETGKERSIVEIWQSSEGKLYGKVTQIVNKLPGDHPEHLCQACEGNLHMKSIIGMVIVSNLQLKNGFWQGGTILDPKKGTFYKCEMWVDGADKLKVKGIHWSGLSRTQTWYRVK